MLSPTFIHSITQQKQSWLVDRIVWWNSIQCRNNSGILLMKPMLWTMSQFIQTNKCKPSEWSSTRVPLFSAGCIFLLQPPCPTCGIDCWWNNFRVNKPHPLTMRQWVPALTAAPNLYLSGSAMTMLSQHSFIECLVRMISWWYISLVRYFLMLLLNDSCVECSWKVNHSHRSLVHLFTQHFCTVWLSFVLNSEHLKHIETSAGWCCDIER